MPWYKLGADPMERIYKNCLVGVHSSISHSSNQQFNDWEKHLGDIISTFNNSPFAKCNGLQLSFKEFVQKLNEWGSCHGYHQACREVEGIQEVHYNWCTWAKVAISEVPDRLLAFLYDKSQQKIEALGGQAVWEAISTEQQDAIDEVVV